jgi:hypothetical protein
MEEVAVVCPHTAEDIDLANFQGCIYNDDMDGDAFGLGKGDKGGTALGGQVGIVQDDGLSFIQEFGDARHEVLNSSTDDITTHDDGASVSA